MSALEDSLRAVYKLPQVGTGAAVNEASNMLLTREMMQNQPPMQNMPMTPEMMQNPPVMTLMEEMPEQPELSAEDQELADRLLQLAEQRSQAPLGQLTDALQAAGTGEDTIIAHLTPGEVILSPKFMEDPEFEKAVENKFKEIGEDPERYVAGSGIANLNIQTGAPEYGFFKKIGKSLKKVVKKVAPVAALIPGVGTALGGVLGGIGGLATKIPGIGGALGSLGSTVAGGIAKLGIPGISSIAGGTTGGFANIGKGLGSLEGLLGDGPLSGFLGGQQQTVDEIAASVPGAKTRVERLREDGLSDAEIMKDLQFSGYATPQSQGNFNLGRAILGGEGRTPQAIKSIEDILKGQYTPGGAGGSGGGIFPGGGGGGFGNFAKMAGIGALAAGLGKLAYEDAKKQKGVALTPLTTMSPTGRYNIEAEIARRMGQQRPNPVEFGLLPEGTLPQLSGGQPRQAALGGAIEELQGGMARGMMQGGGVMAFAQGGAVAMQEGGEMDPGSFPRMDGDINGPGTEQSDDIPAMLSDGEFVMTARAVRGAGSYEMQTEPGGIINLVPSLEEDRERGMDVMYKVMDTFSGQANPS